MISLKGGQSDGARAMAKALGGGGKAAPPPMMEPDPLAIELGLPSAMAMLKDQQEDLSTWSHLAVQAKTEQNRGEESDDDDDMFEDDAVLASLRERRIQELKKQTKQTSEWISQGHGHYTEISQDEFLPTVTASRYSIVHFYHDDFERCKIVDKHLQLLSGQFLGTKFAKLNATKSPFFITKLQIRVLPTIVCFRNGVALDRVVGFEELGGQDDFATSIMARRLGMSKCLQRQKDKSEDDKDEDEEEDQVIKAALEGRHAAALLDAGKDPTAAVAPEEEQEDSDAGIDTDRARSINTKSGGKTKKKAGAAGYINPIRGSSFRSHEDDA